MHLSLLAEVGIRRRPHARREPHAASFIHHRVVQRGPAVPDRLRSPIDGRSHRRIDSARTIKNFWPYSTTVFDYIRRAMPWPQPRTLSNDEVYALTAYILSENKLIAPDAVMNATTLPQVKMPNRDGFITRFPGEI
jgi:cytochrome c